MRSGVKRVLAGVVAVGALVGGCGSGPSQVGAAVIVGDTVVSEQQVRQTIRAAVGREGEAGRTAALAGQAPGTELDPELVARSIVTEAVRHELLGRVAASEGIAVSEAQVDERIATMGGIGTVGPALGLLSPDPRQVVRDRMIAEELGRRYFDRISVRFDFVTAVDEADAQAKRATVLAGGPAADALFRTGQTDQVADAVTSPTLIEILGGIPSGSVVVLPDGQGWVVARVTERRTDLPPPAPGTAVADAVPQESLEALGVQLLRPLADELGVRPNPRYGVWDTTQLRVVGADDQVGSIEPLPDR